MWLLWECQCYKALPGIELIVLNFFTPIGLEMHPHPQDGSPGSFPDAGCVTNHLGLWY